MSFQQNIEFQRLTSATTAWFLTDTAAAGEFLGHRRITSHLYGGTGRTIQNDEEATENLADLESLYTAHGGMVLTLTEADGEVVEGNMVVEDGGTTGEADSDYTIVQDTDFTTSGGGTALQLTVTVSSGAITVVAIFDSNVGTDYLPQDTVTITQVNSVAMTANAVVKIGRITGNEVEQ